MFKGVVRSKISPGNVEVDSLGSRGGSGPDDG